MMLLRSRRQWPRGARISKSDFKVGLSCPFKLLYRKQGLQTLKRDDPMLDFLAEGGFMVKHSLTPCSLISQVVSLR